MIIPGFKSALIGSLGGGIPPVGAFVATTISTANLDTYTFTGASIGAANANRLVVVVVTEVNAAGSTIAHDSCTIGGVTATRDVHNSNAFLTASIFSLLVVSGTTADIVIATSGRAGANSDIAIDVYTLTGDGGVPLLIDTLTALAADPTGSITVEDGGAVIAGAVQLGPGQTCTWTGVTKQSDGDMAIGEYSTGIDDNLNASSRTITSTWTSTTNAALAAASYR